MAHILSVSCVNELFLLMKEKNISPSEALRVGIKALANQEYKELPGEKIEKETTLAQVKKLQTANRVLQEELIKVTDVLEEKRKNSE